MEWINEYQTLKQVNPVSPFAVPEGYFQEMEGHVMAQIRLDELKQNGFTVPENYFTELEQNIQSRIAIDGVLNNDRGFTIPAGYFDELTQNIESRITIDEVLNNDRGFTVPADYFNELTQNIESHIAIDELLNNEKSFTVPTGYFDELEQNIQSRIAIEENTEEAFTIPQGYFEALESKILAQTTLAVADNTVKEERGTVVKLWTKHLFKYASAACFALIAGTGLFLSEFNTTSANTSHQHSYLHKVVSKIPDDEIEAFLQLNTTDASPALNNTDASDLKAVQAATQGSEIKN